MLGILDPHPADRRRNVKGPMATAAVLALLTTVACGHRTPAPKSYPDLARWAATGPDQLLADHTRLVARSIVATRDGFVVGGFLIDGADEQRPQTAAILRSTDGRSWQRVSSPALARTPDTSTDISAVVVWRDTLVAVGTESPVTIQVGESTGFRRKLAVWTSTDGQDWTRLADLPAVSGWTPVDLTVSAGPRGLFVTEQYGADSSAPLIHASSLTDWRVLPGVRVRSRVADTALGTLLIGTDFEPAQHGVVEVLRPDGDGTVTDLSAGLTGSLEARGAVTAGPVTVIAGEALSASNHPYAATWSSTDGGAHWQIQKRVPLPADAVEAELGTVTAVGDMFVLFGTAKTSKGEIGVAWTSLDGAAWTFAARAPKAEFVGLAAGSTTAVVLGAANGEDGRVPGTSYGGAAVWNAPMVTR